MLVGGGEKHLDSEYILKVELSRISLQIAGDKGVKNDSNVLGLSTQKKGVAIY